jgi:hypothetical protein
MLYDWERVFHGTVQPLRLSQHNRSAKLAISAALFYGMGDVANARRVLLASANAVAASRRVSVGVVSRGFGPVHLLLAADACSALPGVIDVLTRSRVIDTIHDDGIVASWNCGPA